MQEQQTAVIDVNPVIHRPELFCVVDLRWKHPLSSCVRGIYLIKQFCNAQVTKLEVKCRLILYQFIACKRSEYVVQMDVLMHITAQVDVVDSLQQATCHRSYPKLAIEICHLREQLGQRTI